MVLSYISLVEVKILNNMYNIRTLGEVGCCFKGSF